MAWCSTTTTTTTITNTNNAAAPEDPLCQEMELYHKNN